MRHNILEPDTAAGRLVLVPKIDDFDQSHPHATATIFPIPRPCFGPLSCRLSGDLLIRQFYTNRTKIRVIAVLAVKEVNQGFFSETIPQKVRNCFSFGQKYEESSREARGLK